MISLFKDIISGQASELTIIISASVIIFLMLLLIFFIFRPSNKKTKTRIENIVNTTSGKNPSRTSHINIRRKKDGSGSVRLDQIIHKLTPRPELLRENMQKAGIQPNIGRLLLISIILGIISFIAFRFATNYPLILGILFGVAFGMGFPHLALSVMKSRRQNKFLALFPDAIDLMVRGIKAGLPITEAIKNAGEEIEDPVGLELTVVTDGVKIGGKLPEELQRAQNRIGVQEFQFFTVALSIQTETGGNLAETLANLSDILRKRKQMKMKVKAMSSEAKASAYIIGSLPFIMFVLIYLMNPDYAMQLFTDPRGQIAVGIGLTMIALGCAVMYKMVKFKI